MPQPESLDAQLTRILTPLGVKLEGDEEVPVVSANPESNPNLTRRLVDHFYDHMGKFVFISTIAGAGTTAGIVLNSLRDMDNSFPNLAINAFLFGTSIVGGAAAGFMGGLIGGMGISGVGCGIEKLEEKVRRHFATK